ncbi:hypothetical protein BU25DRAFT_467671 [Macroventuria anomochaeta]|uniref:Uncharacterized protein n=1 Tax=Macroventuria anomochaeta TaxID=301207 RepID=A0ACB6S2T5_9PLEO|nr:uncharacterized protein BU25DRAFT_467671 [Macroventuria anomochaeta]KAF2628258.1 hypothetical protein BU25DRAFT_467671 [Macroventuria anomochaeta]
MGITKRVRGWIRRSSFGLRPAIGGNTIPNTGIAVNGIMWPGNRKVEPVNPMPWFNGDLASSNPCEGDCGQDSGTAYQRQNGSMNLCYVYKYVSYNNAQEQYTNQQFFLSVFSLGFSQQHAHQIWGKKTKGTGAKVFRVEIRAGKLQYDCPLAKEAACELYEAPVELMLVNGTVGNGDDVRN